MRPHFVKGKKENTKFGDLQCQHLDHSNFINNQNLFHKKVFGLRHPAVPTQNYGVELTFEIILLFDIYFFVYYISQNIIYTSCKRSVARRVRVCLKQ